MSGKKQGRRRILAPLAAAFFCTWGGESPAQSPLGLPQNIDFEDLYLLQVQASGTVLGDSLPAYASDDAFFIDLGAVVASIEFPIARSDTVWSGWFFEEQRRFRWRMSSGVAEISGREPLPVADGSWFEAAGEVFVALPVLERWFDLKLAVDTRRQVLEVTADEPLPFERWRERTLAKYHFRPATKVEPDIVVPDQYRWATQPLVNIDAQTATRRDGGIRTGSSTTSVAAGMDLLKHSVSFAGTFTRIDEEHSGHSESTRRMTIERFSESAVKPILGDIHHYALGDLFQASPNLVTPPNTGRGFLVERYADARAGNLSTVAIAGDAPPGWEVELYRNGTLIEFATVGADGRYLFANQDLYFGENDFIARLYGPQGQVREDRQTYFGGGIELDPGDYDYSVSHIDFSETLLDGRSRNHEVLPASYASDLRYSRALSRDLEIGGAVTRAGLAARDRNAVFADQNYLSAFGRARLGPGVLVGEAVSQQDAGTAFSLEYLTGLGGRTFSFVHRSFDDFDSPATLQTEPLDALTEISALGRFGAAGGNGYRVGIRSREIRGGGSDHRLFGRIGTRHGPVSLTNELEYRVDGDQSTALGSVRIAGRMRRISIRGQVDYSFSGSSLVRQLTTSMNWDVSYRLKNNFTISRNLEAHGGTYAGNIVSVRVRNYDLSFGMTTDFDRDWSLAAGISFAFGYSRRQGAFITDQKPLAHTGRATMRPFVDSNNNGIRDPGEPDVAAVAYRDQAAAESAPGAVTLTALPTATAVRIDTSKFEFNDPFLVPRLDAYEIRTHVGSDIEIDIAVVLTGDIEGSVLDPARSPVRGIELLLLDLDGNELAAARTEFDGYFAFHGIPGGRYRIARIDGASEPEILREVTLDAERGFVTAPEIIFDRTALTETPP